MLSTASDSSKWAAGRLLGKRVRWRELELGKVVEVFLDRPGRRAVGVEVRSEGGAHFLPLTPSTFEEEGLAVSSPLMLLEEGSLSFYRTRGLALSSLVNARFRADGIADGILEDLLLSNDGTVDTILVREGGRLNRLPAIALDIVRPWPPA